MNLHLNFGTDRAGKDIFIDLQKENLHTVFMTGTTGSGKNMLHSWLYKQLAGQNTAYELQFVFMDMTRVDFVLWKSPYLYTPTIVEIEEALDELERLSTMNFTDKALVIHIEECDMMAYDPKRFEKAWSSVHKNTSNVYAIFSTSRPSLDIFTSAIQHDTDMKLVFNLATKIDSEVILGKSMAENFLVGEKVISYGGREILSGPFSDKQIKEIDAFDKVMSHG